MLREVKTHGTLHRPLTSCVRAHTPAYTRAHALYTQSLKQEEKPRIVGADMNYFKK